MDNIVWPRKIIMRFKSGSGKGRLYLKSKDDEYMMIVPFEEIEKIISKIKEVDE